VSDAPPIRVGFSTTNAALSRLIRWFTRSPVSHAWVLYYDAEFDCECVFEFSIGGGQIHTYEAFKKHNTIVHVWTPRVALGPGFRKAAPLLDRGYDYLGLLGMIWVQVGEWLKRKWRNPWGSPKRDFCSESVAHVLQSVPYPGWDHRAARSTSPEKLLEFARREEGEAEGESVPRVQGNAL
jgi:hypothetical protein